MRPKNFRTEPLLDAEGNLLAGPPFYLVAELENGDEEFIMATNITSMAHRSAEGLALEMGDNCRIINGETHRALWRYRAGKGLQEGWSEDDPTLSERRKKHISAKTFTPFPGKRRITHNS